MFTVETTATYTATCEATGCTTTWTGVDIEQAQTAGWVQTLGSWPLGGAQPPTPVTHCPAHSSE